MWIRRATTAASMVWRALLLPLLWPACLAAQPVAAQDPPVYRCGSSYQAKPCPGGVAVDAADPRSDAQRRDADAARQRDAALARQMAAERRAAEREAARQGGPANVGPRPTPAASKAAPAKAKQTRKPKSVKARPASPAGKPVQPTKGRRVKPP